MLRIEDIDEARCRPEYEAAIYEDLAWLGSNGSSRCGGSPSTTPITAPRSQSSRPWGSTYPRLSKAAAEIVPHAAAGPLDPDGAPLYPGRDNAIIDVDERTRRIDAGEPYAVRLDMAAAVGRAGPLTWQETGAGPAGETGIVHADPAANPDWGDVILARKDTPTSYHLAVVVDDAAQGVTDVVRGQRPVPRHKRAPSVAERCSACRRRATTITA